MAIKFSIVVPVFNEESVIDESGKYGESVMGRVMVNIGVRAVKK